MSTRMAKRRVARALRGALACLLVLGLATACYNTNLKPIGETGAETFQPEQDEAELWKALADAEEKVIPKKLVYSNAPLETYLEGIVRKVTPASYTASGGPPISVSVQKDPRLNAFAMGHGRIVVFTGLLAAAENEDQIAGVLAHEVTHITHRHTIRQLRENKNKVMAVQVLAVTAAVALAAASEHQLRKGNYGAASAIANIGAPLSAIALKLSFLAMVNGFSRDLEREADLNAAHILPAAGYNPREFQKFLKILGRDGGERGPVETFFYGQHPVTRERVEYLSELVGGYPEEKKTVTQRARFASKTYQVKTDNARYDAFLGRQVLARSTLDNLFALIPPTEGARELYEIESASLDIAASMGLVQKGRTIEADRLYEAGVARLEAIAARDDRAAVMANARLGRLYQWYSDKKDTACKARRAYERYLALRPDAEDAPQIRTRMKGLSCP